MKRKIRITLIMIVVLLFCPVIWFLQPKSEHYSHVSDKRYRDFHGFFATETINSPISDKERKNIQPVLDRIDYSFAYKGTSETFPYEEPLLKYTYADYDFAYVEYDFEPVAYQEIFGKGYLWIYYNQEYFNENGDTFNGSWRTYSLIVLEKSEDGYIVKEIREHP